MPVNNAPTIYEMLTLGLRDVDQREGSALLERFLSRPQHWAETIRSDIESLANFSHPDLCRADLIQYLKDLVGFTSQLDSLTARLSTGSLRKLVALAVPLWREKGTALGLVNAIRALTGLRPVYNDWFDFRFVLGETEIGTDQIGTDSWIIGGSITNYDEMYSQVALMDDGSLDEDLLLGLVGLMRPVGERIEVVLLDFLDLLNDGVKNRWTTLEGDPGIVSLGTGYMELPVGTWEEANVLIEPREAYTDYTTVHKFMLGDAENIHDAIWYDKQVGANTGNYTLRVTCTGTSQPYNLKLQRVSSLPGTIYQGAFQGGIVVSPNAWYKLRIESWHQDSPNRLVFRVYIDGVLQFEAYDSAYTGGFGYFGFRNSFDFGTTSNFVDNVEAWRSPLRYALIGPGGVIKSSTFDQ